jgi:hypothetical protein
VAGLWVVAVILSLAFSGLLAASILSAVLFRAARRGGKGPRGKAVALLVPFLGLLWLAVAFYIHVRVSNNLAHQDCGLSGDPYVTLPNGYVVGSFNPMMVTSRPQESIRMYRLLDLVICEPSFICNTSTRTSPEVSST